MGIGNVCKGRREDRRGKDRTGSRKGEEKREKRNIGERRRGWKQGCEDIGRNTHKHMRWEGGVCEGRGEAWARCLGCWPVYSFQLKREK